ncbi:sigma factor [Streptomyces sp. NBC_01180]|uniref:sigma factor n=1 Tax=unclassified Streptomyces TaxID=2593676 RepID=UPI003862F09B
MTAGAAAEFESHRSRLFSLAYRLLGSASEAEDAVQDTCLRWSAADRVRTVLNPGKLRVVTAQLAG